MTLIALSEAFKVTIALICIFGLFFPLLVQGLIMFAISVARGEKRANDERRARRQ